MSAAALSPIRLRYRPSVEHVAIAFGLREASDLVAHDLRGTLEAKARDRRRDEHERGGDQHARRADPLQDSRADRTDDQSAERAEQGELRVKPE